MTHYQASFEREILLSIDFTKIRFLCNIGSIVKEERIKFYFKNTLMGQLTKPYQILRIH